MSIIVEDGTSKADSEAYITVADADTYHSARGNIPWSTMSTAEKEQSLRRGTDYIEQVYGLSFDGYRSTSTQALSFPRIGIVLNGWTVSSDVIPNILVNACAEIAYKAASGDLSPDVTQSVKREKVDALEVEYMDNSNPVKRFRTIDNLLAPLLSNIPNGIFKKVVRV